MNGWASILYISPESLRSKTIEHLLLGRNIVRFVIDEAHCFSSWGQDFRVDYLYIGEFIKMLQEKKNLSQPIPVSCFTATAKQKVIEDIRVYFKEKLSLDLELFTSNAARTNLRYQVFLEKSKDDKYNRLRELIEEKRCPTIVYVSRTHRSDQLAQRLKDDGYFAASYHGKMDKSKKAENQDAFIQGEIQVMVATSAFGMGVDKKDVGMVIHYDISDSLENYVQEAGRAGRDESITADCYVLYDDEDLNKHFMLLNQTKLNIEEIQQVWRAVKRLTKLRARVSQSALEIAREAGWDENFEQLETRVKTAIQALEEAGYIRRGQNMPRVYADSILVRNAEEANNKIRASDLFSEDEKNKAIRIMTKLISSRSRKRTRDQGAEDRVDYISDVLAIEKAEVIHIINLLRQEKILADKKDLSAYIKRKDNKNSSLSMLKSYSQIEGFMLKKLTREEGKYHLKELNEEAELAGCKDINPKKLISVLNIWAIKGWIKKHNEASKEYISIIGNFERDELEQKLSLQYDLAQFILKYLPTTIVEEERSTDRSTTLSNSEEVLVEFSVCELKDAYESQLNLFDHKINLKDIEDALFYLSKIEALKIDGGFMVIYNGMDLQRLELDNKRQYKQEDYQKLKQYYDHRVQQIHIVGEYAQKMISDYEEALTFVNDYFQLNYTSFLNKYFKSAVRQAEIKRNITPTKFKELFGALSAAQLKVINDKESQYIVVAAGPGSGKTRVLVHKLASLLHMEDIKQDKLLMLTFSRAAATEFKRRLIGLIGNAANFVEIKTFHSYCFDILGRVGSLEKSEDIIKQAVERINSGEAETGSITKAVLVIDEAQDMDENEFELVKSLIKHNEDMRVIAVGDDDQNIYEFRGSSSKYIMQMIDNYHAKLYELVENYRSKSNLVNFTNQFVFNITERLKKEPIIAHDTKLGHIKLVRYKSDNLIIPLVNDVLSEALSGSTCVLTGTNEQAMQLTCMLQQNRVPARLIQSNDGFNLYNLFEIRHFIHMLDLSENTYTIEEHRWQEAKRKFDGRYHLTPNDDICKNFIKQFEEVNPEIKYKSDLEAFIRESSLEDFIAQKTETVYVSTIHKSKGREFDNVFIMLDRVKCNTDEDRRKLYVAMTRAKNSLSIHYNGYYLDNIQVENYTKINDIHTYWSPPQIVLQLSHKDLWLDFCREIQIQKEIKSLASGDELILEWDCCRTKKGQAVVKYSKKLKEELADLKLKNYIPKKAMVRFIVLWEKENTNQEIRLPLCELYFEKLNIEEVI